ncbi:MAG: hypothetical protein Q7K54_06465 [Candidatus Parcubacteria bacterium]|nr:hypothetical protein [Candidatus Parcubacteria bacterium]
MPLDKNDLKQIKDIVQGSEERLNKKIDMVDEKIDSVKKEVDSVNRKVDTLDEKVDSVKNEIIATISREVTDLAEINHEVIN